jgi:hypothetical protein
VAVEHKMPVHRISAISKKIRSIPDKEVREHLRRDVVEGRLLDAERVEEKARQMLKGRKIDPPDDLDRVLSDWRHLLKHWGEKIEELAMLQRFFEGRNVAEIRAEARRIASKLEKLAQ